MNRSSRIYVAGADTLVGAALIELLQDNGYENLLGLPPTELNLRCADEVELFFDDERPEYVFFAAGKSGGILANQACPATFMLDNLLTATHVIRSAHRHGVTKLLYLASSCCYPRLAPQPMQVDSLLTGPLEPTSAAYAVAKLAGLKLCQAFRQEWGANFIVGIPANVFGRHDDFSPVDAHVIPGLIRKLDDARREDVPEVAIWGSGQAQREFIYSRDLAEACVFVMNHYDASEPINLGSGHELTVIDLARAIAEIVGYRGRLVLDPSKPDGMPRKCLDSSRLHQLGWRAGTDFHTALKVTYDWYLSHIPEREERALPAAV